jgi:hypothetical protein
VDAGLCHLYPAIPNRDDYLSIDVDPVFGIPIRI